jgi:hypothetical protein
MFIFFFRYLNIYRYFFMINYFHFYSFILTFKMNCKYLFCYQILLISCFTLFKYSFFANHLILLNFIITYRIPYHFIIILNFHLLDYWNLIAFSRFNINFYLNFLNYLEQMSLNYNYYIIYFTKHFILIYFEAQFVIPIRMTFMKIIFCIFL